jgi:hypothetical protein
MYKPTSREKILTVHRTIEDEQDGDDAGPSSSANDQPQSKKRKVTAISNTSVLSDTTGTLFSKQIIKCINLSPVAKEM